MCISGRIRTYGHTRLAHMQKNRYFTQLTTNLKRLQMLMLLIVYDCAVVHHTTLSNALEIVFTAQMRRIAAIRLSIRKYKIPYPKNSHWSSIETAHVIG